MQFTTAVVTLFVAAATAQSVKEMVAEIPSCAVPCLQESSKKIGCGEMDNQCQCNKFSDFTKNALICVGTSCSSDDIQKAQEMGPKICAKVKEEAASKPSTEDKSSSGSDSTTAAAAPAPSATDSSSATSAGSSSATYPTVPASSGMPSNATSSGSPSPAIAGAMRAELGMGLFGAVAAAAYFVM